MNEKKIQSSAQIDRALTRLSHEILERNEGVSDVVLVGMHSRGVPLAKRIAETMRIVEEKEVYLLNFNDKLQKLILKLLQVEVKYTASTKYNHSGSFTDLRDCMFNNERMEKYDQVFMEKNGFIANLSILDLLFNLGPESGNYLNNVNTSNKI